MLERGYCNDMRYGRLEGDAVEKWVRCLVEYRSEEEGDVNWNLSRSKEGDGILKPRVGGKRVSILSATSYYC